MQAHRLDFRLCGAIALNMGHDAGRAFQPRLRGLAAEVQDRPAGAGSSLVILFIPNGASSSLAKVWNVAAADDLSRGDRADNRPATIQDFDRDRFVSRFPTARAVRCDRNADIRRFVSWWFWVARPCSSRISGRSDVSGCCLSWRVRSCTASIAIPVFAREIGWHAD